jgi:predicted metal-dependent HD superfamily phosphohydrolase
MTLITAPIVAELRRRYSDRPYHNWSHIESMLRLHREYREFLKTPTLVEAAIYFHDAVYDSIRRDNEKRSADLAVSMLGRSASGPMADILYSLVMSTAKHEVPLGAEPDLANDIEYLLDFDLSILGATEDEYDAYVRAVRAEYSWASDDEWKSGRESFLNAMAAKSSIFHTAALTERYEARARENMIRELDALTATASTMPPMMA